MIKEVIKKFTTFEQRKRLMELKTVVVWFLHGQIPPAPHIVKRNILKNYGQKYNLTVFIETGTYKGDTVYALKDSFKKIISIELDATLYQKARERFRPYPKISILQGDSAQVFEQVLPSVKAPTLFWLDGHYSGEHTGHGSLETPIMRELELIFSHPIKNHVILIDDARLFTGEHDYPKFKDLALFVKNNSLYSSIEVNNDIIRITP